MFILVFLSIYLCIYYFSGCYWYISQITFKRHGFKLCRYAYMWIILNKYTAGYPHHQILQLWIHPNADRNQYVYIYNWESIEAEGQLNALFYIIFYKGLDHLWVFAFSQQWIRIPLALHPPSIGWCQFLGFNIFQRCVMF